MKTSKLTYYVDDHTFNGEYISENGVPNFILNAIPKSATIAFVGEETSPEFKRLKDAGYNVTAISEKDIQGREYDYTVVDKKFEPISAITSTADASSLHTTLQSVYTLMTRSRKGTVFINSNLSDFIDNERSNYNDSLSPLGNAIDLFRQQRLPVIQQIIDALSKFKPTSDTTTDGGTTVTIDGKLKPETDNVIHNDDNNDDRKNDEGQEFKELALNDENLITVYDNVSVSGIDTSDTSESSVWNNNDGSNRDLGIFLKKGKKAGKGQKRHLVDCLLDLKSALIFGTDYYSNAKDDVLGMFDIDAFKDVRYFVRSEKVSGKNRLTGYTEYAGLLNKDRSIYKSGDMMVNLIAKIKGKDGKEYEVTLGSLNSPDRLEANADKIKDSITTRIAELMELEQTEDVKKKIDRQQKKIDNFESFTKTYRSWVDNFIKSEQEYELLNPPVFSDYVYLQKIGDGKTSYRVSDYTTDNDSRDINAVYSPYNERRNGAQI